MPCSTPERTTLRPGFAAIFSCRAADAAIEAAADTVLALVSEIEFILVALVEGGATAAPFRAF